MILQFQDKSEINIISAKEYQNKLMIEIKKDGHTSDELFELFSNDNITPVLKSIIEEQIKIYKWYTIIESVSMQKDLYVVTLSSSTVEDKLAMLEQKILNVNPIEEKMTSGNITLEECIEYMKQKNREMCNQTICTGVDVELSTGTQHFSLSDEKQRNIENLFNTSIATGLAVPYHADNGECTMYSLEDIVNIYFAAQTCIMYQTTYCNMLNTQLKECTDIAEAKKCEYGSELQNYYYDKLQAIITSSSSVIDVAKSNALSSNEVKQNV